MTTQPYHRPHWWTRHPDADASGDLSLCRWCGTSAMRPPVGAPPQTHCPAAPAVESAEIPIQLMATMVEAIYGMALIGNAPLIISAMFDRMTHPEPGDLVAGSSWYHSASVGRREDLDGFGVLLRIEDRPSLTPGDWNYGGPSQWGEWDEEVEDWVQRRPYSEAPRETMYVIRPLDRDTTFHWWNESIVAVPTSSTQLREWQGRTL